MLIYGFEHVCNKCKRTFTVYTYLRYKAYNDDVFFPYEKWVMNVVYTQLHPDFPYLDMESSELAFPVLVLGDDPLLDQQLLGSGKVKNLKIVRTRFIHAPYVANICPHDDCQSVCGKYHILSEVTDKFLKTNSAPPEMFEI